MSEKRKNKKKKADFEDDGRVIANMNIDGMPWYVEQHKKQEAEAAKSGNEDKIELTREEERAMIWGIVKAALLVGGVFLIACALFLLFCVFVWFK